MRAPAAGSLRALLSIGTNSTRLLLAKRSNAAWITVSQARRGTRLGQGLGPRGMLRDDAIARTLAAAVEFVARARENTPQIRAIATSAMRRARNARALSAALEARTGLQLEIIPGEEEARYSFVGALAGHGEGLSAGARVGVLDAGGGSTEFAVGAGARLERSRSFEIGAVRLTEETPLRADPPPPHALPAARERARAALAGIAGLGAGVVRLICVGGTATTCAAMLSLGAREAERVDGMTLARAELTALAERLAPLRVSERCAVPGLPAQRADIIVGGLIVLEQALEALSIERAIVSVHDLLLGYVIDGWKA
ncbi:Ppx/GppA family phosphatase [bacterium]|nr:MAG: Ppx/GppA family phosphatase [bacterium]